MRLRIGLFETRTTPCRRAELIATATLTHVCTPPLPYKHQTRSSLPRYTFQMLHRFTRSITAASKPSTQTLYRSFRTTAINMGVTKQILIQGNGTDKPKAGDNVTMIYTGWLEDSSKSDNKGKQYVSPLLALIFAVANARSQVRLFCWSWQRYLPCQDRYWPGHQG